MSMNPTGLAVATLLACMGGLSATASWAAGEAAPRIVLRADSNRDGRVDLKGQSDETGKAQASVHAGALVLPNIDDDTLRCAPLGRSEARQACFDAADDIVNGDLDLLDMAVLRTVPAKVPDGTTATLVLEGKGAEQARVFVGSGTAASGYALVTASTVFMAAQLRKGLNLRVEAKTFARDLSVWDGTITVALTAKRGSQSSTDRVQLRVAPLLTHSHADAAQQLITTATDGNAQGDVFITELAAAGAAFGVAHADWAKVGRRDDIWAQDFFEPMYASVPAAQAPGGAQTISVLMRTDQYRDMQLALFDLQGKDVAVGAITLKRGSIRESTYDSGGNLETIPPYPGQPMGRQILGGHPDGSGPAKPFKTFLMAQQLQAPLMLVTDWLDIGHVDEFVAFLPAPTALGFRILLADPDAGLAVMRDAVQAGHGEQPYSTSPFERDRRTLSQVLADPEIIENNRLAKAKIEANLALILNATGATPSDVVRLPALFTTWGAERWQEALRSGRPNRLLDALTPERRATFVAQKLKRSQEAKAPKALIAKYPGAANLTVLGPTQVAMPKQHAPLINGVDMMQDAIARALAPAGVSVSWIEDYALYHQGGGEVHCGSNTLRAPRATWWRAVRP